MATTPPPLGYGQRAAVALDAFNKWFRSTPQYYAKLKEYGQDPNNVHLNDSQKQGMIRLAQSLGAVVDEGHNGQEVDDSGNFQAKSHALRNTLIVAGIAGAALLTAGAAGAFGAAGAGAGAGTGATVAGVEGGAYGVGASTVAALGTGAMAAVPVTAATTAAISAAASTIGTTAAQTAAAKVAATGATITTESILKAAANPGYMTDANGIVTDAANVPPDMVSNFGGGSGMSYGDLLKYGLPVAGNLIGGVIQAKATGAASDAQQKYLEEALAYQKESDAYNRQTDASRYADTQRNYAGYQDRLAPFIANGITSNDRMTALLGLPARAASSSGSSSGGSQGVPVTPDITAKLTDYYKSLGLTPTGPGSGPTDIGYMAQQIAATGGLTPGNVSYWLDTGPNGRITQELNKAGVKYGAPQPTPPAASAPPSTAPVPMNAASVQLRAPDGSIRSVSQSDVKHWTDLGATPVQGAA
jgi:hypothetical protein